MAVRVHLCGRLTVEGPDAAVDERDLPGRQGRLALALLVLERRHPVTADRLADAVSGDKPTHDATATVAPLVSKLRSCLLRADRVGATAILSGSGCYHLRLPAGSTVDIDDARSAIDRAEGCRRHRDTAGAWTAATVAVTIANRGLLPGEGAEWVVGVQRELVRIRRRGFECLSWLWATRGDGELAAAMAEQAIAIDSLHEPSWHALMQAHLAAGNRAAAVRTYDRCRRELERELQIEPGAAIESLMRSLAVRPRTAEP